MHKTMFCEHNSLLFLIIDLFTEKYSIFLRVQLYWHRLVP